MMVAKKSLIVQEIESLRDPNIVSQEMQDEAERKANSFSRKAAGKAVDMGSQMLTANEMGSFVGANAHAEELDNMAEEAERKDAKTVNDSRVSQAEALAEKMAGGDTQASAEMEME